MTTKQNGNSLRQRRVFPRSFRSSIRQFLLICLFLIGASFHADASHLVGGQITYTQIAANQYSIRLVQYRDCAGIALPTSTTVNIQSTNPTINTSATVTRTAVIDRTILCPGQVSQCNGGTIPGVEEHIYEGVVTLPTTPANYTISYGVCCRASGVNNLNGAGNQEFFVSTILPHNLVGTNSSPNFLNPPSARLCAGQPATIALNAFDPDGDAIVYSIISARRTATVNVTYAAGLSASNPLSSSTGFSINPNTGVLSFTPTIVGQRAVIAIKAEEYRNGVKIGEVARDFEVTVVNCGTNATPVIAPISNVILQVGQNFCTNIQATDANNNLITLSANSGIIPPGTFVTTSSTPGSATATFCFTPTPANAGNTYSVTVNAVDNNCPSPASATTTFNITVPAACNTSISTSATDAACGQSNGTASATLVGGTAPFAYYWTGPNNYSASSAAVTNLAAGTYSVTIVDGNSCVDTAQVVINNTGGGIMLNANVQNTQCGENNGSVSVNVTGGTPPYTFSLNNGTPQMDSSFGNLSTGSYVVTVKDSAQCPQNISFSVIADADTTAPMVSCTNITVYLDANGNVNITPADIDNGTMDNCDTFSLAISQSNFTCENIGANQVILTATDASNNAASCTATVTVADTTAPEIECQDATIFLDANGLATLDAMMVLDHDHESCGILSYAVSQSSFSCTNVGANSVTLYATDSSMNVGTCSATVTVQDTLAPMAVCKPATIQLDANGMASITTNDVDNGSSDNCAVASMSVSPSTFTCADAGANTVTLTVTDVNGNSSTCTSTVTVEDNIAPVAICKDFTLSLSNGTGVVLPTDIDNGSTDNCSFTSAVTPNTFTCADAGQNPVTLTITDASGNIATCSATVTVLEAPACSIAVTPSNPTYTGGVSTNLYLGYGPQSATLTVSATGGSGFTYDWSPATGLSNTNTANPVFTPTAAGNYTFIATVTNSNGCSTTCSVTFCVKDARAYKKGVATSKVVVCHIPQGNPGNAQTISIDATSVSSHVGGHTGDYLGACGDICLVGARVANNSSELNSLVIDNNMDITVYPNPFRSEISLRVSSNEFDKADVYIYDLTGRVVAKHMQQATNSELQVGKTLASGVYILEVRHENLSQKIRVIKE